MSTLYKLTMDKLVLLEMAQDPEVDAETLADTMEAVDGEFEDKAEAYAIVIRELEAEEKKFAEEIARLSERKRTISNNIDRIKRNLESAMITTGKRKFKAGTFSFNIVKNQAAVVMDEPYIENVPEEYLIPQDPKIDRKAIKEAIKNGVDLEGIAHLEQTEGLRIR